MQLKAETKCHAESVCICLNTDAVSHQALCVCVCVSETESELMCGVLMFQPR